MHHARGKPPSRKKSGGARPRTRPRPPGGGGKKKKPAAPYSRTGGSRTTLGEEALDFRVRNGNGYFSLSMATGKKPELES